MNTRTIVVALETPTKKYTNFTLTEVNNLYEISNLEAPDIPDLPSFEGILTKLWTQTCIRNRCGGFSMELDSRIQAIPSHTTNEATCSNYVCSFLTQAVLIFEKTPTLAPERALRGRHGHRKVDYSIEATSPGGMTHILGVTEAKYEDFRKGVAQNLVQLESSLTRCGGDEEEEEEDKSVPLKAYGIVTDAVNWYMECRINQSENVASTDPNRARFRISKLDEIINYRKDKSQEDTTAVLGQIVWLMKKMVSEIPKCELRHKRPKSSSGTVYW
ncbi:hypothetical protein BGX26_005732 [Mortierella sp. AD094]|nr:hypothetical protein BGX26_005732 [Mortierella sp. AD094]